uniref:Uncharacterized protein n=1 Tax=Leviviridae sp. TaxID=2027243 RepID=A0A514D4A7_9VIRU|nr:MAG: hypothetical protein H1RhizoLitter1175_000003 [Leviviridae sp.]
MLLSYHLQLLLSWTIRIVLLFSIGAIYMMTSGCSHKYDITGTSSGVFTKDPPAADSTTIK